MKAKFGGYIAIAVGIAVAIGFFGTQNGEIEDKNSIFHVTLANPENYEGGIFTATSGTGCGRAGDRRSVCDGRRRRGRGARRDRRPDRTTGRNRTRSSSSAS